MRGPHAPTISLPDEAMQLGLSFAETLAQKADAWMHTPGGRHVLKDIYAIIARMIPNAVRHGVSVSIKHVFEEERWRIKCQRAWMQKRGKGELLKQSYGFTLNNSYTASIARHVIRHQPTWEQFIETREVQHEASRRPIFVKSGIVVEAREA